MTLRAAALRAYRAGHIEGDWEGTMRHLFEIVGAFAIGAAVLVGIGLAISAMSTGLELVALR